MSEKQNGCPKFLFLRERFQSKDEKVDITVSYSIFNNIR